jgi:hypothetical protein
VLRARMRVPRFRAAATRSSAPCVAARTASIARLP